MRREPETSTQPQCARSGWRDDPITAIEQDRLRRAPFAEHAARLISANHTAESSVVYGLEGPWGSGKSSVIALITSFLTSADDSRWQVVPFTPWATTGTEGLLAEFFAALSAAAPQANKGQQLRDRITTYADIARPLVALIPIAGAGLVETSRTVEGRLRKPWNVAFDEVAEELRTLGTPLLVVVDDIDRLQPTELLDLLKVVRLLGRFPGVDFLLAYDEQTLVETLQNPARGRVSAARARSFMEKIVQYPLSMPPLLNYRIVKLLDAGLTEVLTPQRVETGFDKHRFAPIILTTMPSQLTTPRAIERFLAQVREQFRVHDLDEVNDVDLILATFLRVQFPDLFGRLQRWKPELTRGSTGWIGSDRSEAPADWDGLLNVLEDEQDRQDALAVLQALFPAVSSSGNPSRANPGRFAHPDYFDRYLAQAVPEGDIPDSAVADALAQAAAGDGRALRGLLTDPDDDQVTLAMGKIRDRYPDIASRWDRTGVPTGPVTTDLLGVCMGLLNDLTERHESWTSPLAQASSWAANLLRLVLDSDPDAAVDPALAACGSTQRRARVVGIAAGKTDDVRPQTVEALQSARRREAQRIVPVLIADLRDADRSEGEPGALSLYHLVDEAGLLPELKAAVRHGLDSGEFTLEDVAARFVSFAYLIGGPPLPSSASFSGELFTKLTDVAADSTDHDERSEWTDTSWPRRREFAARYIHRPAN
ncbi:MAG: KAP family NTPase [Cellulomonas sp.]|uniref:KAP family P-loop NTPase fold protein n=1 Tax=Cellulomonas sp. TaxID=40001 RepID=UPI0025839D6D|nr:P-loop NTPase fold protein [Cellulomonas sp.]MCR6706623.1 KAP family NTPase [Cellulomonas sp.]